ncbi:MAG: methyltransferase domain-containing protein [Candidatus Margulisbacteria bacterium]|nr:methyltransferase domain-containing protein [Candidatus Margulisiibacteriota bacterium]
MTSRLARIVLPKDSTFWRVYSPIIKILADSKEHQIIRSKINHWLRLEKKDNVLEVGCGKGVWLSEVEGLVSTAVGLDAESKMLEGAAANVQRANLVLSDLNQPLPFSDGSFSKVTSILVEGYLRNRELSCAEKFRVLAPGGMLAVVTPKKGASFFRVLVAEAKHRRAEQAVVERGNIRRLLLGVTASLLFGKMAELKAVVGEWHFYEKDELVNMYREAGFEVVACESVYANQAWLLIARKPS